MAADVRIRWNLDVVDRGAGAKLLRQDREIRRGLEQTDRTYKRMASTATSASARQASASARVERGIQREGRAAQGSSADFRRYNSAQREALTIGQQLVRQADRVGAAYRRQGREMEQASRRERAAQHTRGVRAAGLAAGGALGGGLRAGIVGGVGIGASVAATAGLAKAISLGNEYNRTIDSQNVGFTTLLKSRAKAAALMKDIQTLAIKSPVLDVQSTGDATRTLLAYGISLKNVLPLTKAIGDMSAASGKQVADVMPRAALALGQIAGKGKLQAQEMNQLAESVGLSRGAIRKALHLSSKDFEDTFKPGKNIKASKALPAILDAMRTQSAGAADRLAKTTQGKLARAREVIAKAMGQMTRPLYDAFGDLAGKVADALQNVDFTKVGTVVAAKMKAAVGLGIKGAGIAATIAGGIGAGLHGKDPPGGSRKVIRGPGGRVESVETKEPSKLAQVGAKIGGVARTVGQAAATAGKQLLDAFKPAMPFLQNVLLPLLEGIGKGVLISVVGAFKVLVPIIKVVATVLGTLGKWLKPLRPLFEKIGVVIGVVFAGPILKAVGAIGKLGGVFRLVGAAVRIVAAPVRLIGGLFGGLIKIGAKVVGFIAGKYLGIWVTLGARLLKVVDAVRGLVSKGIGAAKNAVTGIAKPFLSLGSRIAGAVRSKLGDIVGFFGRVGKSIIHAIVGAIKAAPGVIKDAVMGLVPGPVKGAVSKVLDVVRRRGGRVPGFRGGGMVDVAVSPGEALVYRDRVAMVPGAPTAADSVQMRLPAGTAVLTHDGQQRVASGASLGAALNSQMPHFRAGGVVGGRYTSTAYGPPWGGIQGGGRTATGVDLHKKPHLYGIAVDPSMIPLGASVYAKPNPFGYSGAFRAFDTGGAIKGRRIDFYDWRGRKSQNSWGRRPVTISATSLGGSPGSNTDSSTAHVPIIYGRSRTRAGLVNDALSQGISAGGERLTRSEISRAYRGARGARVTPILEAIASAQTATRRDVKIPGAGSDGTKLPSGVYRPSGTWNPRRLPIARWITPYLTYGASHGWSGVVTSGYRDPRVRVTPSPGLPVAPQGQSNHNRTSYPGGAVDVSKASQLAGALRKRKGPHLLQWAGSKDPVHFSHPHGGSYRRGGVVGAIETPGAGRALTAAANQVTTFAAGSLQAMDEAIGRAAGARLEALRAALVARVRQGGDKKTVQRFQGVIDLVDFEIGRRIGAIGARIEARSAALERQAGSVDRSMRKAGIEPDSVGGLMRQGFAIATEVPARRANVRSARSALNRAKKTGDATAIAQANDQLVTAQDDLDEALTKRAETARNLVKAQVEAVKQKAQDRVDTATFGVDVAQSALGGLDVVQRLNRTTDTSQGKRDRAAAIQQNLLPTLSAQRDALYGQAATLGATGDVAGARQAFTAAQSAATDLGNAMADAADLIRDAAEQAAQDLVDAAQHGSTMADLGKTHLELEQRIAGTYDTGGQARSDYIKSTVIPALNAELTALQTQAQTAADQGDPTLARQVAEAIAGKQNDILQATLDATQEVADNTSDRKVGGTVGWTYGNENVTDSLIAVGNGS